MQNIKLIELINKIPISDIERLSELLIADKKVKPDCIVLYEAILQNKTNQNKNVKEHLWKTVFGKQKINENQFRKLCFELLQKTGQALAVIETEKNEITSKLQLLHYYSTNTIEDFFEDKWNKIKTVTQQEKLLLSSNQSFFNYSLELIQYDFLVNNPSKSKSNNIINTSVALDEYYILQKLKLLCHAVNEEKFTTYSERPAFYEYIIEMAKEKENPLIDLYSHIYSLLTTINDDAIFISLKEKIATINFIDENEWRIIFQYAINYCIIQLNKGKTNFEHELFDIYKTYLEKINDKIFSPFRYKNIINLSLKLKQYNFAATFIDDYGKKLPTELQQTSIAFNKAKLNYELKKFDLVIEILQHVKTDDITFNLSTKVLLVKIFYDKKEFQFLESFLESFRVFVLRSKQMNTTTKKTHFDFIKISKKLINLDYKSRKEIDLFTEKINKQENLTDKTWLLEKINAI